MIILKNMSLILETQSDSLFVLDSNLEKNSFTKLY